MQNKNELSPQESLLLIQSMIDKSKHSFSDNSFYFLFWGWLVFFACITQFVLKVWLHFPYHFIVWWTMPIGGIITAIYGNRQAKKEKVKTYVGEAMDYVWAAIAFAFIVLVIINMTGGYWENAFTYYILLYAIGTYVTGKFIKFKPLVIGGGINFVLAIICSKLLFDYQLLMGATAILISYIIPGHLLRKQYKKL
jgi:hypothetical protein